MTDPTRTADLEKLAVLVRKARRDGIYECDDDWEPIDHLLDRLDTRTEVERKVWDAWNALPDVHPSPVKRIAADLGMTPADVAFVVYPAKTFGRWADHQEPDLEGDRDA